MSYQDGHRQRVKARFREEGLDNFSDEHIMELLLFYCVPRQNTKDLAYRLIEHFGSLTEALDATTAELEQVEGVGEGVSTFLRLIRELMRQYYINLDTQITKLKTLDDYSRYLKSFFLTLRNEVVYLLCLDAKCEVLCCKKIGEGSINAAVVSVRKVVETAINANAVTVVLAHNHPSGVAIPSQEDVATTVRIAKALQSVDIFLADHVIVSGIQSISMVQTRYFNPYNLDMMY